MAFAYRQLASVRHFFAQNLKSVEGMESIVQEKIAKEVKEGRVLGHFTTSPLEYLRASPLRISSKKGTRGL